MIFITGSTLLLRANLSNYFKSCFSIFGMLHAPVNLNKTHCPTSKLSRVGLGKDTDTQPIVPVVKCLNL